MSHSPATGPLPDRWAPEICTGTPIRRHFFVVVNCIKFVFHTDSIYSVYKDKLQNCSCNQFE